MIRQITQRLHEVNTLLATYGQGVLSFEQVLPPSLFYQDFNDTNLLVKEAACLVKENPGQLLDFSSSLLSETNKYLSLDRTPLQVADFETLFREHLKPLELRYEEAKASATKLWSEYSAMSSRLDFLPLDSEEYRSLDAECGAAKAKYDVDIKNGCRSVTGISVSGVSNRCSSTCWWSVCRVSPEASSPTSDA